jgi:hypothetical protein
VTEHQSGGVSTTKLVITFIVGVFTVSGTFIGSALAVANAIRGVDDKVAAAQVQLADIRATQRAMKERLDKLENRISDHIDSGR